MNKFFLYSSCFFILLGGCRSSNHSDAIVSMQIMDRNGFAETISNKDRLNVYQNVNFLSAQPYQKVLRVYGKDNEGKSNSKLTSYHPSGGIWQYLEALDGRAHGHYLEWHENGKLKIEASVLDGLADLSEMAQKSWLFDQECSVYDTEGNLEAEFLYDKGILSSEAKYYFSSGKLKTIIPYSLGLVDGPLQIFDEEGNTLEEIHFQKGQREGSATGFWNVEQSKYQEQYRDGFLINAIYFDPFGSVVGEIENGQGIKAVFENGYVKSLIQYASGTPEGEAKIFTPDGKLLSTYQIKDGKKINEEWEYYPSQDDGLRPKLMITWYDDQIQGMTKTWYQNGVLESEREMSGNKKHGLSFAYYKNGDIMLMEEYENDLLCKGSYYKKGEDQPISTIEGGCGTATLHNPDGFFLKKISYEKGKPLVE